MNRLLAAAALVAALVACPAAVGHGDGAARGYTSTVKTVAPRLDGLTVQVLQGDDQLDLRNNTGRELVVEGYEDEPYLRFGADGGVFRNANSPATYLNEERYGGVDVPASASKTATPRWERVSRGNSYNWHDHRIHWMSTIDPPKVREARERAPPRLRLERPRQRRRTAAGDPRQPRLRAAAAEQLRPDPDRARRGPRARRRHLLVGQEAS